MNNYIEYFTNYVKDNYDFSSDLITLKYYHSLRVAKLMVIIARKLNLSDEDVLLAFKIGLCHDLGRFHEVVRSGKFNNQTFDHACYSNKILYNDNFISYMDIKENLLFRKAIYLHNKKELTENLSYREAFFANMLRDADKIDILRGHSAGKKMEFTKYPTLINLYNFMNDLPIDIGDIHNKSDSTILYLSFIKDLVFDASSDILLDNNFLNHFIEMIDVNDLNSDILNNLIQKIHEKEGKKYVR